MIVSYVVLARKYRPRTFDEVVGQQTVTKTLRNAIEMDRIPHACLFSGPRGIGKTTMARIFAKALDCEKGPTPEPCNQCGICESISSGDDMDVIEIDGASNNSVEDIRDLREKAQFTAARARYKVYIIDEVHMLSKSAFNALLKTLEEPPPHVKFIFATTELNKVPDTVQSRCQRFDFFPLKAADITERLGYLCKKENIQFDRGALGKIAQHASGSMRDAESALDQVISLGGGKVASADVDEALGTVSDENLLSLLEAALAGDAPRTLGTLHAVVSEGADTHMLATQLARFVRDLMVMKTCGADTELVGRAESVRPAMTKLCREQTDEALLYATKLLCETERKMFRSPHPSILLEMCLLKLEDAADMEPISDLMVRLENLTERPAPAPSPAPVPSPEPAPPAEPVPPAEPPAPAESAASSLPDTPIGAVQKSWNAVLDKLKEMGKHATAALLKETEPLRLEGNELIVGIHSGYQFHKEHLEEFENRQIVEDAVEETLGTRHDIQFVTGGKEERRQSGGGGAPRKKKSEVEEDPVVKKTMEVFDANVVSVEEK